MYRYDTWHALKYSTPWTQWTSLLDAWIIRGHYLRHHERNNYSQMITHVFNYQTAYTVTFTIQFKSIIQVTTTLALQLSTTTCIMFFHASAATQCSFPPPPPYLIIFSLYINTLMYPTPFTRHNVPVIYTSLLYTYKLQVLLVSGQTF